MKFARRAAGYSSWAVAAVMALETARPALAQPPIPIGASKTTATPEIIIDAEAPVNVQVAWLGDAGLYGCSLVAKATPKGLECSGFVPNEATRQKALYIAKEIAGDNIIDRLHIQPGMPINCVAPAAPAELAPAASTKLAEALGERVLGLRVISPSAGKVEITGRVDALADKLLVSKCLKGLRGCTCVTNRVNAPMSPESAGIVANVPAMMIQPTGPANPVSPHTAVAFAPGMPPMSATKIGSEAKPAKKQISLEIAVSSKPKPEKPLIVDAAKAPLPRTSDIGKLRARDVVPPPSEIVDTVKAPLPKTSEIGRSRAVEFVPPPPIEPAVATAPAANVLPPIFGKTSSSIDRPVTSKPVSTETLLPAKFGGNNEEVASHRPQVPKALPPELPPTPASVPAAVVPDAVIETKPRNVGRAMVTDMPANKTAEPLPPAPVPPKIKATPVEVTPAAAVKTDEPKAAPMLPKIEDKLPEVVPAAVKVEEPKPGPALPKIEAPPEPAKPTEIIQVAEPKPAPVVPKLELMPEPAKPTTTIQVEEPKPAPALPKLEPMPEPAKPTEIIKVAEPKPAPVVPKFETKPVEATSTPAAALPEIRNGNSAAKPTRIDLIPEPTKAAPVERPTRIDLIPPVPAAPIEKPTRIDLNPAPAPVEAPKLPDPVKVPDAPKVIETIKVPEAPKLTEPAKAIETPKQEDTVKWPEAPQWVNERMATRDSQKTSKSVDSSATPKINEAVKSPYAPKALEIEAPKPLPPVVTFPAPTPPAPIATPPATAMPGKAIVSDLGSSNHVQPAIVMPTPAELPKPAMPSTVTEVAKPNSGKAERFNPAPPAAPAPLPLKPSTVATVAPAKPVSPPTNTVAAEANIKGVIRQPSVGTTATLDAETVRRAVEDVCRGGATELKVAATGNKQLTISCKVPGHGEWERLYARIKNLPEIAGYSLIYNITTIGAATASPNSAKSAAPMMGIIRTAATSNAVESGYLKQLLEELCRGKAEDVVVRTNGKQQINVGMKVRSTADWNRLYECIKALPEVAGYAVIYNVTIK